MSRAGSRGPRPSLLGAGLALTVAGLLLTRLEPHTGTPYLVVTYLLFGIGFGLVNAPITNTAVSGMPRAQAGVAAATASTSRQVGTSLGVAISGTLIATTAAYGPVPAPGAWYLIIGAGVLVLLLGLLTTGRWAARSAARVADRLEEA